MVTLADAPATREVVQAQRGRVPLDDGSGDDAVLREQRDEERKGTYEVRRVLQESLALSEVLVHEAELLLLQVAKAAVDHLRGLRARAGREVARLDQRDAEPSRRCVHRDPGARHAPTDDHDVVGAVDECVEDVSTRERGHRAMLAHRPH